LLKDTLAKSIAIGRTASSSVPAYRYRKHQEITMPPTSNAHWLRKSAERGNAEAQFMYALMHANGRGVPKDRLAAYFWLLLASTQLPSLASRARDEVARYLSPKQCADAQVAAQTWRTF